MTKVNGIHPLGTMNFMVIHLMVVIDISGQIKVSDRPNDITILTNIIDLQSLIALTALLMVLIPRAMLLVWIKIKSKISNVKRHKN